MRTSQFIKLVQFITNIPILGFGRSKIRVQRPTQILFLDHCSENTPVPSPGKLPPGICINGTHTHGRRHRNTDQKRISILVIIIQCHPDPIPPHGYIHPYILIQRSLPIQILVTELVYNCTGAEHILQLHIILVNFHRLVSVKILIPGSPHGCPDFEIRKKPQRLHKFLVMKIPSQPHGPSGRESFICPEFRRTVRTHVEIHQITIHKRIVDIHEKTGRTTAFQGIIRLLSIFKTRGKGRIHMQIIVESDNTITIPLTFTLAKRPSSHHIDLMFFHE